MKVPELAITTPPPPPVETGPEMLTVLVAIEIPAASVVASPPEIVVVPVPPVCANDPTLTDALQVTLAAVPMAREVKGAKFPTKPVKVTELPAPGLMVRLRLLIAASALSVLLKVKEPPENTRLSAPMRMGDP